MRTPRTRSTDFLRDALAPARDRTPVVQAKVVPVNDFDPVLLGAGATPRPRVVVLSDVPRLNDGQQEALTQFLRNGGGLLVSLGPRAEPEYYNGRLYRNGAGWLPARLEGAEGNEAKPEEGVRPAPGGSDHPALRLFLEKAAAEQGPGRFPQLGQARYPRWWKVGTPGRNSAGVVIAHLRSPTAEYPYLVEWVPQDEPGRVILCAVPLDVSWGADLPQLPAFVPLVHELVYYLAGARSTEFNLEPGQPLRYRLDAAASLEGFTLEPPGGEAKPLSTDLADPGTLAAQVDRQPQGAVLRFDGTRETGVYRLRTSDGVITHYVVRPRRADESDLTPADDDDRARVAALLPGMKYQNEREALAQAWVSESHQHDIWSWLLLGLVALLCAEVWMTRRIVKVR
jgi:hypothetical protein